MEDKNKQLSYLKVLCFQATIYGSIHYVPGMLLGVNIMQNSQILSYSLLHLAFCHALPLPRTCYFYSTSFPLYSHSLSLHLSILSSRKLFLTHRGFLGYPVFASQKQPFALPCNNCIFLIVFPTLGLRNCTLHGCKNATPVFF